jgi:endonuclease I
MKPMRHGAMRRGVSSETTGAMSLRTCRASSFRARARGYQARCRFFGKDQTELNESRRSSCTSAAWTRWRQHSGVAWESTVDKLLPIN